MRTVFQQAGMKDLVGPGRAAGRELGRSFPPVARREFFRAAARYTLLALLAAVAAVVARSRPTPGQSCLRRGLCESCGEFAACTLPPALSARRTGPEAAPEPKPRADETKGATYG